MREREALKLALDALERSVATCFYKYAHDQVMSEPNHFINQTITAIREVLAQSDQESDDLTIAYMNGLHDGKNKYAPQREWVGLTDEEIEAIGKDDKVLLAQFHTSVKAIDEMKDPTVQIMNLVIRQQGFNFAKAIEAALREKNGG